LDSVMLDLVLSLNYLELMGELCYFGWKGDGMVGEIDNWINS